MNQNKKQLNEVTRWEMIRSGQHKSPDRFKKKDNYSPKDFKNVNFEDLFDNDTFTWSTRVHGEENYIVTISFEGAFDTLKYKLKSMRGKNRYKRITLDMLVKALSNSLDTEDLYVDCTCPDFCLTSDTLIDVVNSNELGSNSISIGNLFNQFNEGKQIIVYSYDNHNKFVKGNVTDIWISGQTSTLIKITLSNGKTITTTTNHKYLTFSDDYICADKLIVGDIIRPYNYNVVEVETINLDTPINVYDLTVDNYNNFLVSAGAILHNCYRFAYWATQADCKYGTPQNTAPTVRNVKNNKGYVCKHILAILYGKRWVQSAAKAWLSYMQANPDLTEYYIWGKHIDHKAQLGQSTYDYDDYYDDNEDEVNLPWAH